MSIIDLKQKAKKKNLKKYKIIPDLQNLNV